jgi:hypothetical protein
VDLKPVIRAFDQLKAEGIIRDYALGGAMASIFYVEPFLTYDIDLFVSLATSPTTVIDLSPIYRRLEELGHQSFGEHVQVEDNPVQILVPADALDSEALKEAKQLSYAGLPVRVFDAEHLLAIYLKVNRPKDRLKCQLLLDSGVLDLTKVEKIVRNHNLEGQWNRVRRSQY